MESPLSSRLPDPAFWRGKRVFLTGHTGFKGTWLTLWLQRLGAEVTGFALTPEKPSLADDIGIEECIASVQGNICDGPALYQAVQAADPEIILHMAAQALVRLSYREPVQTFATNVMGTAHVLEAARHTPSVRAVVVVTTDKCYENREWAWPYRETDALGGHDPYSASKACAELVTAAWRRSFLSGCLAGTSQVAVATARAGNVIGGGDWSADRLIPDCIRSFAAKQAVSVRNPQATRPWQHVLEPLCGYLLLAEELWASGQAFAEAWNFGPMIDDVQPVSRVVQLLAEVWGDGAATEISNGPHPHEAGFLAVDAALARARLGWRPRLRLESALEWTGRWYKQNAAGADPARLVEADIERYESLEP